MRFSEACVNYSWTYGDVFNKELGTHQESEGRSQVMK